MMPIQATGKIWMDGEYVDWDEARVHILTPSLHYGWGVFEGIRAYETADGGSAVFRLTEHMQRLFRSAKIYHMEPPVSLEGAVKVTKDLVAMNGIPTCYIRPIVYLGYGEIGLNPLTSPVRMAIASWPWGAYLGEDSFETVFLVRDGVLCTPPLAAGCLAGITRASILQIAEDEGIRVREDDLVRTDLYLADEAFFTGTAAEVVPIREVDDRVLGDPGPITRRLQEVFTAATRGRDERYRDWLEPVT